MIEEYNILTLDNGKDYAVNKVVTYKGSEYLLLVQVDDDENILDEKMICEKVNKENSISLIPVTDKILYNDLSDVFIKELLNEN